MRTAAILISLNVRNCAVKTRKCSRVKKGTDTEICHFQMLEVKLHFDNKFIAVRCLSGDTI